LKSLLFWALTRTCHTPTIFLRWRLTHLEIDKIGLVSQVTRKKNKFFYCHVEDLTFS
jgi:hypothetical protein